MTKNILEYLEKSANNFPSKVAIADENTSYTYFELLNYSKSVGSKLSNITGSKSPICVYMEKSCFAIISFLGIIYSGCFYSMIDTRISN